MPLVITLKACLRAPSHSGSCLIPSLESYVLDYWEKHPDIEKVKWIQAKSSDDYKNSVLGVDNAKAASDDDLSEDELEPDGSSSVSGDESPQGGRGRGVSNDGSSDSGDDADSDNERQPVAVSLAANKFAALEESD